MVEFPPLDPAGTEALDPGLESPLETPGAPETEGSQDILQIQETVLSALKGVIPEGRDPQVDFSSGGKEKPIVLTITIPPPEAPEKISPAAAKVRRMTKGAAKDLSEEYSEEFLRNMDIL
jgi:hypothetical protein